MLTRDIETISKSLIRLERMKNLKQQINFRERTMTT